jgi:tetratricopeptide (TPR) repeat protein
MDGVATLDERAAMRVHLESCVACRSLVLDATLPLAPAPAPSHRVSTGKIEIGDAVGRYIVIRQIGAGGMGVVYAAYDPELDRKVALKLIRRPNDGSEASTYARETEERLLREGQAMARVAHPNVTAVYDVGRHSDQVFVAMELIAGETLAQWLAKPRSTAQILDVFKRAAQGLQAAHAVELVHRDFKPNNVMIDGDGRVRVMDFGLARPTGAMPPSPSSPSNRLARELTVTGMLMGTPAYMAPEQLRCEPADARSDQFSFCVTLYEALCGTRPYLAATTDELLAKIHAREMTPPTRKAPGWLVRVIDRGLKPSPDERWPSMQALIDALDRDPSRRRGRWLSLLGAAALLIVAAVSVVVSRRATMKLCRGGDASIAAIWGATEKAAIASVFGALPRGAGAWPAVAAALDRHAAEWSAAYTDACEATRVRGDQSAELLDRRMACLHEELTETSELISVFAHADAPLVERALSATEALDPPSKCSAERLMQAKSRIPSDPRLREEASAIADQLARSRANDAAGRFPTALSLANDAATQAAKDKLLELDARAHYLIGFFQLHLGKTDESEAALRASCQLALLSGSDDQIVKGYSELADVLGPRQGRFDAAHVALDVARGTLERLGKRHDLEAIVSRDAGNMLAREGKLDEGIVYLRRALELQREIGDPLTIAVAERSLGQVLSIAGKNDESVTLLRQSIASIAKLQGPDGPLVGNTEQALIDTLVPLKRFDEAIAAGKHAVEVAVRAYGEDNHYVVTSLHSLGFALNNAKRPAEAVPVLQRAIVIGERIHDKHRVVPECQQLLGAALFDLGRFEEARASEEQALANLALRQFDRAAARFVLARSLWELGRDRQRAVAIAADAEKGLRASPPGDVMSSLDEVVAWRKQHDPAAR